MPSRTRGSILLTVLVLMALMAGLVWHIYMRVIIMQQLTAHHWHMVSLQQRLRKSAVQLSKAPDLFHARQHLGDIQPLGEFRYRIDKLTLLPCAVLKTGRNWRAADQFDLQIWHPEQAWAFQLRFARINDKLRCAKPKLHLQNSIISQSFRPVEIDLLNHAL